MSVLLHRTIQGVAVAGAQLERANIVQRQIMGVVGHDLRSPLSVISMSANELSQGEEAPDRAAAAQRIVRNARRMEQLICFLMDVTRLRANLDLPMALSPVIFTTRSSAMVGACSTSTASPKS
jgi:signal transduction histidine kinase